VDGPSTKGVPLVGKTLYPRWRTLLSPPGLSVILFLLVAAHNENEEVVTGMLSVIQVVSSSSQLNPK
jgi:hypothetical protein